MGAEPREPFPKQKRFLLHTETPEVSYGGAAGGAKSVALLFGASQYLHVPGYAALLLRASFPDLMQPNALIPLSKEWWLNRPDATWSVQERRWTFACSGGGTSTITFGYLERDDDVYQYQGAAYQFIGIDELTQHTEFRYGEPTYVKPVGLLQCGHGYMAVENDVTTTNNRNGARLQCGHGYMAVENGHAGRGWQPRAGASMRPRLHGRGEPRRAAGR